MARLKSDTTFRGGDKMFKTITIGNHLSVQGTFVQMLKDGLCQVRVGTRIFTGHLIGT